MKLSWNQERIYETIGDEWATISPVFGSITRTSESLQRKGLIETRLTRFGEVQARRVAK